MEEATENGKESSNSAHANGMNEWMNWLLIEWTMKCENSRYVEVLYI